jgi:hypothetical protein
MGGEVVGPNVVVFGHRPNWGGGVWAVDTWT